MIENDPNLDTFWGPASGQRFSAPSIPYTARPRFPGHQPWRNPNSKQGVYLNVLHKSLLIQLKRESLCCVIHVVVIVT